MLFACQDQHADEGKHTHNGNVFHNKQDCPKRGEVETLTVRPKKQGRVLTIMKQLFHIQTVIETRGLRPDQNIEHALLGLVVLEGDIKEGQLKARPQACAGQPEI